MPTIARFNVTPVKSTALHHPEEIFIAERGVAEDRRFLFLDPDGRRFAGGEKGALFGIRADYDPEREHLTLVMPDGEIAEGEVDATDGAPVRVALYDREVDTRLVAGNFGATTGRSLGRQVTLARVEAPEHAGGVHPVTLISLASVDELGRRGEREDRPDPRRFRMLVEIDGCDAHEEDTWSGRRIRLGDAIVRVGDPIPRCVITTLDPDSGEPDFPALDVLATYRRVDGHLMFGMYGDVETPGRVRVGDPVMVLDD